MGCLITFDQMVAYFDSQGTSPPIVNGAGVALVADQGPGADAFCVQEPLEWCDNSTGATDYVAKGTSIRTDENLPFELSGGGFGLSFSGVDVTTITPAYVPGTIITTTVVNPDQCHQMLGQLTLNGRHSIAAGVGPSFDVARRVMIDTGTGTLFAAISGSRTQFSNDDAAAPNTLQGHTAMDNGSFGITPIPAGGSITLRSMVLLSVNPASTIAMNANSLPVTATSSANFTYHARSQVQ